MTKKDKSRTDWPLTWLIIVGIVGITTTQAIYYQSIVETQIRLQRTQMEYQLKVDTTVMKYIELRLTMIEKENN